MIHGSFRLRVNDKTDGKQGSVRTEVQICMAVVGADFSECASAESAVRSAADTGVHADSENLIEREWSPVLPAWSLRQLRSTCGPASSVLVGHGTGGRSILGVHMSGDCLGEACSCRVVAERFLQYTGDEESNEAARLTCAHGEGRTEEAIASVETRDYDSVSSTVGDAGAVGSLTATDRSSGTNPGTSASTAESLRALVQRYIPYVRNSISVAYLIIAVQGADAIALSSQCPGDFRAEVLAPGEYLIRDFFLMDAEIKSVEESDAGRKWQREIDSSAGSVSAVGDTGPGISQSTRSVASELHRKFGTSYTPSDSVPAVGLVLQRGGSQVVLQTHAFLPGDNAADEAQAVLEQVGDKRRRPGHMASVKEEQKDGNCNKAPKES